MSLRTILLRTLCILSCAGVIGYFALLAGEQRGRCHETCSAKFTGWRGTLIRGRCWCIDKLSQPRVESTPLSEEPWVRKAQGVE